MKNVLIIGGSKGIGAAILAEQLNKNYVINISRTQPEIQHSNLTNYSCDVLTDELPDLETIDSIIYCPGSINLKPFSRLKTEDFVSDFNINVLGAIKVIQKYAPLLKDALESSILLFSSVAVTLGMPYHSSIAVSKAGVEGLVKSLAAEFAPAIRVNAIAPTVTDTNLASRLLRNESSKEAMKERHPLKKYLNPKEVASMADFLISEKSSAMSGQIIKLDCGIVTIKN